MTDTKSRVIKVTSNTLKIDEAKLTEDSHFVDDLGADSLDQVELMMAFESEFDCDIPDEDASTIATIKDAIGYIEERKQAA